MRVHVRWLPSALTATALAMFVLAVGCVSGPSSVLETPVVSPVPSAAETSPQPTTAVPATALLPTETPWLPTATPTPTAEARPTVFVPGPFNTTPKPVDVLQHEKQALIERIDAYLNRLGYRPGEQYSDVRQLSSDCEVRHDATIHPQARGEVPLVLISLGNYLPCTGILIYRWDGRSWRRFMLDFGVREDMDPVIVLARQEFRAGMIELGIAWNSCLHCSLEHIAYRLLRLVNGKWQTVWAPTDLRAWRGTHGTVKFVNGLNRLEVTYSDFSPLRVYARLRPDDRQIFGAANGGPHRYFIDTWQRSGDRYRLVSTISLPSTYKTAVEFSYALIYGYTKRAAAWTTNATLVSRSRELGLDAILRSDEILWANDSDKRGGVVIGIFRPDAGVGNRFLLRMTKSKTDWLVSAIEKTDLTEPP